MYNFWHFINVFIAQTINAFTVRTCCAWYFWLLNDKVKAADLRAVGGLGPRERCRWTYFSMLIIDPVRGGGGRPWEDQGPRLNVPSAAASWCNRIRRPRGTRLVKYSFYNNWKVKKDHSAALEEKVTGPDPPPLSLPHPHPCSQTWKAHIYLPRISIINFTCFWNRFLTGGSEQVFNSGQTFTYFSGGNLQINWGHFVKLVWNNI